MQFVNFDPEVTVSHKDKKFSLVNQIIFLTRHSLATVS